MLIQEFRQVKAMFVNIVHDLPDLLSIQCNFRVIMLDLAISNFNI